MWFDVRKLLANADFQDIPDVGAGDPSMGLDPSFGIQPAGDVGIVPGGPTDALTIGGTPDALAMGAGSPADLGTTFAPGMTLGGAPGGFTDAFSPAAQGAIDPSAPADTTTPPAEPPAAPGTTPATDKTADRLPTTTGGTSTATMTPPARRGGGGAGGGGGGAGGAGNPVAQFFNAIRGLGGAAQGGNPQAQQLMNFIRQMMARGGIGNQGPFGGGMGGFGGMGGGLMPGQLAQLRMMRQNRMNMLRQNMANQHRGVGRFGGRDFSRHVQNIDNEMMALGQQMIDSNIKNSLAQFQALQQAAQQNFAQSGTLGNEFQDIMRLLFAGGGAQGGSQGGSPGTFAQPQVNTGTTSGGDFGAPGVLAG